MRPVTSGALESLFLSEGHQSLEWARSSLAAVAGSNKAIVAYLTYENPWARSGGIAAVASRLPSEMESAGIVKQVVRLSPLHRRLETAPKDLPSAPTATAIVKFDDCSVETEIWELENAGQHWTLFGAEGFFEADGGLGGKDPYVFSEEGKEQRDGDDSRLLRDSLFACAAVPVVLRKMGLVKDLIVHAQDWQFAMVALTVKEFMVDPAEQEDPLRAAVVLTLHNPFDHSLSERNLSRFSTRHDGVYWPEVAGQPRPTVLSRAIPLVDAPVSTVSDRFAEELVSDPLQTGHFARHFVRILEARGVQGIDNGLFRQPREAVARGGAKAHLEEKSRKRRRMLEALASFLEKNRSRISGDLDGGDGRDLAQLPDDVPFFLMTGRLDPGQRGFDVLARAIEMLPKGFGRFFLSPLSPLAGDPEVKPFLEDLEALAQARPGEVVVAPFFLTGVFGDLQAGATWSIWPSLYEPFGGVSELYIEGTPLVARDTGGLAQQVEDFTSNPTGATGILYREATLDKEDLEKAWSDLESRGPSDRMVNGLYRRLVAGLVGALIQAREIYRFDPDTYGRILSNLPTMQNRLSWARSVKKYREWYRMAVS